MGKSIGILSLKGGVGKTSTTVALGEALSKLGKGVLLVDANFSAPNLGMHLNVLEPEKTIQDAFHKIANISHAILDLGKFHLLPADIFGKKVSNPTKLKDKLRHIKRSYDYVLIDSSPALNEETLAAMLASDEVFIVTTPDYSTLSMTIKAIKLAQMRGTQIGGIILNRVYGKDFELSIEEIEKTAGVPILAVIPHDTDVLKAQSQFLPFNRFKPRSSGAKEFDRLAETITGIRQQGFFEKFLKFRTKPQEINRELYYKKVFE